MRIRLQKFDFLNSHYERPNQKWVCGHRAEGRPCQKGPDAKGNCHADFECMPLLRDGRWQCTRSDFAGGRCETGPLPDGACCRKVPRCKPVMSWRARPTALARRLAALTFGLLLVLVAGSTRPVFLNPGPVTFQHSGVDDCSGCHSAFKKGPTAWIHAAFAEKSDLEDSNRCLACHDLGPNRFDSHSMPPTKLAKLLADMNTTTPGAWPMAADSAKLVFANPKDTVKPLACMTCHQEHHGNSADLEAMDDARCQFCHTFQFANLEGGHPEFFGYPYERRTRIVFDHTSHLGKHFRDDKVKSLAHKECSDCHAPDPSGRAMLIGSFEQNCAACHRSQVEGTARATAKGMAVFNVPGLDVATLKDQGAFIGGWPEDAEGEVTPFMDFLLSANPGYAETKKALARIGDLLDLHERTADEIAAVRRFAWQVKELTSDLAVKGVPALKARIEKTLGRPLTAAELVDLSGRLPVDTVRAAARKWFPALHKDVAAHRAESARAGSPPAGAGNDNAKKDEKPSGTLGGGLLGGGLLGGGRKAEPAKPEGKPGGGLLGGGKKAEPAKPSGAPSGGLLGGGLLGGGTPAKSEAPAKEDEAAEPEDLAPGEDWSAAGGWYIDYFALNYRPTGHADRFVKAWLDVSGRAVAPAAQASAGRLFETLGAAKSQGSCGKCHSIDAEASGGLAINWQGPKPIPGEHRFTTFSHTAHFSLLDEEGCLTCHVPNTKANYLDAFKGRDPKAFVSNFSEIERGKCARCHTPAEAGDACLTCHNYHIGTFRPATASTPKMMSRMGN